MIVTMPDHSKKTLLHLPPLVPPRSASGGTTAGLSLKRSAKPHAGARPKPLGERGIPITLSPVGSKSVAGLPSRPNPCVYPLL